MLRRLLDRLFPRRDAPGARVDPASCREVSPPDDASEFFRALPHLVPAGSRLALEASSMTSRVAEALRPHEVEGALAIERGTLFPRSVIVHLPLDDETAGLLAALLDEFAAPEICDHVHVHHGNDVLLSWYDAFGDNPIVASSRLSEESLRIFADRLGVEPERGEA